ncbi:MAG: ABC-F family ATP-binding cassette domain-containing protein [Spirochaetota bacterium]
MAFIQLSGLSLSYGHRTILDDLNFTLGKGDKAALTGANGSGKSTLMKIMAGIIKADSGNIITQRNTRISYLPQSDVTHAGKRLRDEVELAFDPIRITIEEKNYIESELEKTGPDSPETGKLLEKLHELQETVIESGYYTRQETISRVLTGLGFSTEDFTKNTGEFSEGWQMRIALAKILLEKPDILLLDEPTNYLDLEARIWLTGFLSETKSGVFIVSHDRHFLDTTVNKVTELFQGKLMTYKGNYSEYERRRRAELNNLVEQYERQQEEIAKIEDFIRRFRCNASKARLVQSRIKYLEKLPRIEIPESMKKIHFQFPLPPHSGRDVIKLSNLCKSYGTRPVIGQLDLILSKGEKLVITGKNGAGKSTLLRIIAGQDTDYTGEIRYGSGVKIGYFSVDREDTLNPSNSVIEEMEAFSKAALIPRLRNLLGAFLFRGDDIFKRISVLSGGERSRLSLLKLLLNPTNLLILDEPTNHLDINSKDVLLEALQPYSGTLVFVSHDRYFIEKLATKVLELEDTKYKLFYGGYSYYLWKKEADTPTVLGREKEVEKLKSSLPLTDRAEDKRKKSELKKLQRESAHIMEKIESLEKEHQELQNSLALPEVYQEGEKVKKIKTVLEKNLQERQALSKQWEQIEKSLESINANTL